MGDRGPTIRQELELICRSEAFSGSRKSQEFLRYVVLRTLEGDTDSLKERSIGVELLGREASYDTGSDASVRVRANEVRRRLNLHYTGAVSTPPVKIELFTGSYVPRFSFLPAAPVLRDQAVTLPAKAQERPVASLSLLHLSLPAFIALFLCAICIRWHFSSTDPAGIFWQSLLRGRTEMVIEETSDAKTALGTEDLRMLSPLLSLAGKFGVTAIVGSPGEGADVDSNALEVIVTTAGTGNLRGLGSLSVDCRKPCRVFIRGTNRKATQTLVAALSDSDHFPARLASQVLADPGWHGSNAAERLQFVASDFVRTAAEAPPIRTR